MNFGFHGYILYWLISLYLFKCVVICFNFVDFKVWLVCVLFV